jgi:DNA-binding NarL/FixJ family response regulator
VGDSKEFSSQDRRSEEHGPSARVLIADDNPAILDCVAEMLLDADYEVVGLLRDGSCVLTEAEKARADVVVLDISMGDVSGLDLAKELKKRRFAVKIIFLTVHEDLDFLRAAIAAGGSAYVVKSRLDLDLLPALQEALRCRSFVSAFLRFPNRDTPA